MKFSIITATWNAEKYLNSCLLSVHNQLFDKNDFEHIIQDSCSTDMTFEIASKFTNLIFVEKDLGQSDAINKAIRRAKGEYILLLDADDILLPNTLKLYDSVLSKTNLDVIYGNIILINQDGEILKNFYSVPFNKVDLKLGFFCPPSVGVLIRRDLLINNLFDVNHHYNMDTEWFLRCNDKLVVFFLNEFVAKYRFHDSNKTNSLLAKGPVKKEIIIERAILKTLYREKLNFYYKLQIVKQLFKIRFLFKKLKTIISYKSKLF